MDSRGGIARRQLQAQPRGCCRVLELREGIDMSPLPEDIQPPAGWVCKRVRADELVFAHDTGGMEVAATSIDETQPLPFDLARGWEVTCRIHAGESTSEHSVGRVTTRAAAVAALRSCMERANRLDKAGDSPESLTPATIAADIDLRGEIPSPSPPEHGTDRRMTLRH